MFGAFFSPCLRTEKHSSYLFFHCSQTSDPSDHHSSSFIILSSPPSGDPYTRRRLVRRIISLNTDLISQEHIEHTLNWLLDQWHITDLQPAGDPALDKRRKTAQVCVRLSVLCPIDDLQRRNLFAEESPPGVHSLFRMRVYTALNPEGEFVSHDSKGVELKIIWSH